MSKFDVNVCLPPSAAADVHAALAAAMAPFDINRTADYNPDGQWDWWRVGAGVGERFAVRPGHDGDPRLVHAEPTPYGPGEREPLLCDGGPRRLLDFEETRRRMLVRLSADDPHADFGRVADWALTATALLTLEGQWIEALDLGPFEVRPGERAADAYARQSTAYLEALDEDCFIVCLFCHC